MLMNEGVEIRLPEQPQFWHCLISEYLAEQQESFPFTTEWVSWTSLESTLPTLLGVRIQINISLALPQQK